MARPTGGGGRGDAEGLTLAKSAHGRAARAPIAIGCGVLYAVRVTRRLSLLVCVLAGCGAGAPASGSASGSQAHGPGQDQGHGLRAPAEECPASFDDAENMRCGVGEDRPTGTCSYPEGECTCGLRPECSGAEEPPPDPSVPQVWVWVCRRTPPEVRPDGCPGVMPTAGTACDEVGKRCWYGECCVEPVDCTAAGWSEPGMTECPP